MISRVRTGALLGVAALLSLPSVRANDPSPQDLQCAALIQPALVEVQGAPTQLTHTQIVPSAADRPSYCRVQGYVWPNVGLEMWLPIAGWNHKFLEIGCAGNCGVLVNSDSILGCHRALKKGYACIASDLGHHGRVGDGLWARDNPQAVLDFSVRATHVIALAGKGIAQRYYGAVPVKSYFFGCSCGGYQGLSEAQRFPWDFDGIIAGAPAQDGRWTSLHGLWKLRAARAADGQWLFTDADLQVLHRAALERCDMDDGLKDGIISNPLECRFNPAILLCKPGQAKTCLSQQQVQAAKRLYDGAPMFAGYSGGSVPGSELGFPSREKHGPSVFDSATLRFTLFDSDPGPNWRLEDFDFQRDFKRISSAFSPNNPDLRVFKAAGGKLILYHGWADTSVPPRETIDYYELIEKVMGGRAAAEDFVRLFMIPGMTHCALAEGDGPNDFDFLRYLEDWVERGEPPQVIIGAHVAYSKFSDKPVDNSDASAEKIEDAFARFMSDPVNQTFTRPVYAYPNYARYRGIGDPNSATSFDQATPR